jgi:hypothetical protein
MGPKFFMKNIVFKIILFYDQTFYIFFASKILLNISLKSNSIFLLCMMEEEPLDRTGLVIAAGLDQVCGK